MPRGRRKRTQGNVLQGNVLMKSAEMIGWAIGGIEREIAATRDRLASLTAQANALRAKLPAGGSRAAAASSMVPATPAAGSAAAGRRQMSPEGRRRISEMMTKRWADRRAAAGTQPNPGRKRGGRRKMSAEARKRISDAQKKRWAEQRKKS